MSKNNRKAMNEAIVQYARVKDIYLDLDSMENLSFQICNIFPTEEKVGTQYSLLENPLNFHIKIKMSYTAVLIFFENW